MSFDPDAFDAAYARWLAWACPSAPTPAREDPLLARLRERTASGAVDEGLAALDREMARARKPVVLAFDLDELGDEP